MNTLTLVRADGRRLSPLEVTDFDTWLRSDRERLLQVATTPAKGVYDSENQAMLVVFLSDHGSEFHVEKTYEQDEPVLKVDSKNSSPEEGEQMLRWLTEAGYATVT